MCFSIVRFFFLLLTVFLSFTATSQLCNGSLGDPAVNITFGSGGGPSGSVPTTSYGYQSSTCPNDGFYTTTGSTSNCFGNTWHTVLSDHTGNGGAFMLVNASHDPGDFFLATVTDLCPNTTYEFAAWVMNVMRPVMSILPNITFKIETPGGTVLNSFNTGDIAVTSAPTWEQYGFFFTTPANNAVIVLRMTNNAPGGYGNDVALDDITFRPCGSKITSRITNANTDTVDICEGNNTVYTFDANIAAGYVSPLYQWQVSADLGATWNNIAGATSLIHTRQPTGAGNYWYRLTVVEASVSAISSCRIASDLLVINVHPSPVVNAGPDRIMLAGNPIIISAEASGEQVTYSWTPDTYISNTGELSPTVSPPGDLTYTLLAESAFGCVNSDEMQVKVVTGIYVPSAFTPNGDGKNDNWEIPFLDPSFGGTVNVFNRWGELVYHVSAATVSWNGKLNGIEQASGVYIYTITFRDSPTMLKGTFTLIR